MEEAWLRSQLESGRSIESIAREVGKAPSTVAYWAAKYGLASAHAAKHAPRGGIDRDTLRRTGRWRTLNPCAGRTPRSQSSDGAALAGTAWRPCSSTIATAARRTSTSRIAALRGRSRGRAQRPRSASCSAPTATPKSNRESLPSRLAPRPALWGSSVRGSSTGRCARLLIERLWVRVPPPELFEAALPPPPHPPRGVSGRLVSFLGW